MTQLPKPVLDTVVEHGLRETPVAWIQVSKLSIVLNLGGSLDIFGLEKLAIGANIQEYAVFLDGILSLNGSNHFTSIQIDNGEHADISLIDNPHERWLILFSCAESLRWKAIAQQKTNELNLLQDKTKGYTGIDFCCLLNQVVLEKNTDNSFRTLHSISHSENCFYPDNNQQWDKLYPTEDFPFLNNFIEDCQEIWKSPSDKKLKSGPWIEIDEFDQEYALEATAISWQHRKILLIEKLSENYQEHHTALQFGRESVLKKQALEKKVEQQNTLDELTGFANRSLFYDYINQNISKTTNNNTPFALLLLEIENYKELYQALDRSNGDQVIKEVGRRIATSLGSTYNIARLEGHIFSILLTAELADTLQMAMTLQQSMHALFIINKIPAAIQTCIGIALFPEHGQTADKLVQKAWVALYMAREHKYGYAVYTPNLDRRSTYRLTLMSELRQAITFNQLVLHYQAKVCTDSNTVYGAEALIRWTHPTHGMIFPDEFILMAERSRTIQQLSLWVIKQAFIDAVKFHNEKKPLVISINLSAKDLNDPELPDLIANIQEQTQVNPEWIIFEITEGSVMNDPKNSIKIIRRLNEMGYRFSIDDFGTGYSSLTYLRQLPLVELKIDRSFIENILSDKNDAVIVHATINLAKNLDLQVVAEGVENAQVMEKLKNEGCHLAQGYYLNKPLCFNDFNTWLSESQWHI